MTAAAILAGAQRSGGAVRLAIGGGAIHRYRIAALSSTMVTLEREDFYGARSERVTVRLAEIEVRDRPGSP